MGSVTRYSNLEAFGVKFSQKIIDYYQSIIGLTVEDISEVTLDYYVSADVTLSDGTILDTHFRWSSEEEENLGEELKGNPDDLTYHEYFNEHVKGKVIVEIDTGYDRDDNYYAYIVVEGDGNVEVPIYFDPEGLELGDSPIISREEFDEFREERINR